MEMESERRQDAEFRMPHASGQPGEPAKPAVQARQGITAGRVLTILVVGIVLVMAGFAISYVGAV